MQLLQDDPRYKNVEDANDREELFNDFVHELEKKEREDREKAKKKAHELLGSVFDEMRVTGSISRRSTWVDCKRDVTDKLTGPEFKALDDTDVKRAFVAYVDVLDKKCREEERQKREELQRRVDALSADFKGELERLAGEGVLTATSRWKDSLQLPEIADLEALKSLETALGGDRVPGDKSSSSSLVGIVGSARDVFEKFVGGLREELRADKRLVRDTLDALKFSFRHDSSLQDVRTALSTVVAQSSEDGEEVECASSTLSAYSKQLRTMFAKRPSSLAVVFADFSDHAKQEYEEDQRKQRKREKVFVDLLEENFYRSDHVGVSWDEAKDVLSKHSSYDAVTRSNRHRIFQSYMEQLAAKFELKKKNMQNLMGAAAAASGPAKDGETTEARQDAGEELSHPSGESSVDEPKTAENDGEDVKPAKSSPARKRGRSSSAAAAEEDEGRRSKRAAAEEDEGRKSKRAAADEDEGRRSKRAAAEEDEGRKSKRAAADEDEGRKSKRAAPDKDEGRKSKRASRRK